MSGSKLNTREILALETQAHHLHPIVMIGQRGLTESVTKGTDAALTIHELIKIRVFNDDRTERIEVCDTLCETLGVQLVQHTDKSLALWRKKPNNE